MASLSAHRAGPTRLSSRRPPNGIRPKASRPTFSSVAEVRETPTDLFIRVRLEQGALELSVPKRALVTSRTPGSNPDATPC